MKKCIKCNSDVKIKEYVGTIAVYDCNNEKCNYSNESI